MLLLQKIVNTSTKTTRGIWRVCVWEMNLWHSPVLFPQTHMYAQRWKHNRGKDFFFFYLLLMSSISVLHGNKAGLIETQSNIERKKKENGQERKKREARETKKRGTGGGAEGEGPWARKQFVCVCVCVWLRRMGGEGEGGTEKER